MRTPAFQHHYWQYANMAATATASLHRPSNPLWGAGGGGSNPTPCLKDGQRESSVLPKHPVPWAHSDIPWEFPEIILQSRVIISLPPKVKSALFNFLNWQYCSGSNGKGLSSAFS